MYMMVDDVHQGLSEELFPATELMILCARAQWVGYIKDYDGGTLMECIISDRLPYTDLPGMLRAQRAALDRHIRTLSKSHVVHPGLTAFRDGQRRIDIASIPGEPLCSHDTGHFQTIFHNADSKAIKGRW